MPDRLLYICIILLLASCNEKKTDNTIAEKIKLMDTDRAFSKLSAQKGMKHAFLEYIDSNGVLLKPGYLPIAGANAIDYLIQQNDSNFTLTWQPHNADVAASADMGYTYGIYSLEPAGADTVLYGTYVSIWRKQKDGSWKFVLDSGNEGIEVQ